LPIIGEVVALPTQTITKLLIQLGPYAPDAIKKLRELIDTLRKPGAGTQKQLDDLKQAIELQLGVNNEINEQLKLIKSVLENVQSSLKILGIVAAGVGIIAVIALVLAATK